MRAGRKAFVQMAKINAREKTEEYESCMHLIVFVLVIM